VAATPGAVVFRNELFELLQYQPVTETASPLPLLYIFSQVNRFYLGDLTPDRSLFQRLLDAGIPVYAISWRNPTREQSDWNIDTYADGVIDAIRVMQQITRRKKVHLMGLCAGGLVAAAAAGVLEARGDNWIDTLSLFVNVLDSRPGESEFGLFVTERSVEAQKAAVRARGVFTERNVFEMFAMLRIEENVMSFFRSNYLPDGRRTHQASAAVLVDGLHPRTCGDAVRFPGPGSVQPAGQERDAGAGETGGSVPYRLSGVRHGRQHGSHHALESLLPEHPAVRRTPHCAPQSPTTGPGPTTGSPGSAIGSRPGSSPGSGPGPLDTHPWVRPRANTCWSAEALQQWQGFRCGSAP
jgi:hypothetical protein